MDRLEYQKEKSWVRNVDAYEEFCLIPVVFEHLQHKARLEAKKQRLVELEFDFFAADRARGPIKGILKKPGSPASGKTVTFKVVEQPIEELEAAMLNSQHFKRSMDRLVAGRQRRAERLDQNELEEIQAEMVLSPEQLVAYEDARRSAAIAEVQKIVAATEYKKINGWRPIFRN